MQMMERWPLLQTPPTSLAVAQTAAPTVGQQFYIDRSCKHGEHVEPPSLFLNEGTVLGF